MISYSPLVYSIFLEKPTMSAAATACFCKCTSNSI